MQTETSPHGTPPRHPSHPSLRRRFSAAAAVALAAASAGAVLAGCGGGGDDGSSGVEASPTSQQSASDRRVLWLGDSIAAVEAPALRAALKASGARFKDASSDGGGTVVEGDTEAINSRIAKATWKDLKKHIASFQPNVIAYQTTTYDWGTPGQQRSSYEKLARTARDAGAELVLVSAPPFRIDDFYEPHESEIESAPRVAEKVADAAGGQVHYLDSARLWGSDPGAQKAQRSADGIHTCQQGSAAFAKWLTGELGERYDFTPAAPQQWAGGSWTDDKRFANLDCD